MAHYSVVEQTKHKVVLAFPDRNEFIAFQKMAPSDRMGIAKQLQSYHMDAWIYEGVIMAEYARKGTR